MEGPADLEQWPWKSQQTFDVSGVDFLRNMGCLLRMGVCETLIAARHREWTHCVGRTSPFSMATAIR